MSAVLAEPIPSPGRPGMTQDRAVLILDDCEFDRLKICRLIEEAGLPFDVVEVDTLDAMEAALAIRDFDLVLIDYYLVGATGFQALEMLETQGGKRPVAIMVTGDEQTEIAVEAMKRGCADYLSKVALSPDKLRCAVLEAEKGRTNWTRDHENRLQAVEELTGTIVSRYSNSVRPELARIVRELREVKSDLAEAQEGAPTQIKAVERRCIELWGQLRDPETYRRNQH